MALGVQRCRERELLTAIAQKAVEMRALQKAYFKDRRQSNLTLARKAEIQLDELLVRLQGFEFMQARRDHQAGGIRGDAVQAGDLRRDERGPD